MSVTTTTKRTECDRCEEDFDAELMDTQTCIDEGKDVYALVCNPCVEYLSK